MIDLSSIETVWVVLAQDGIDEPERLVCFATSALDADRALKLCEDEQEAGQARLDPMMKPGKDGTEYRVEMTRRWPDFGQRVDERDAGLRSDVR